MEPTTATSVTSKIFFYSRSQERPMLASASFKARTALRHLNMLEAVFKKKSKNKWPTLQAQEDCIVVENIEWRTRWRRMLEQSKAAALYL